MKDTGFGDYIRSARERLGMSQDELARALGVSNFAVRAWETGLRYPSMPLLLQKAIEHLDCQREAARRHELETRYRELVRRSLPDLSMDEWIAILGAHISTWLDAASIRMIPEQLVEAAREEGLKMPEGLPERLRAMSYAELLAIAEVIERAKALGLSDPREAIQKALEEVRHG